MGYFVCGQVAVSILFKGYDLDFMRHNNPDFADEIIKFQTITRIVCAVINLIAIPFTFYWIPYWLLFKNKYRCRNCGKRF